MPYLFLSLTHTPNSRKRDGTSYQRVPSSLEDNSTGSFVPGGARFRAPPSTNPPRTQAMNNPLSSSAEGGVALGGLVVGVWGWGQESGIGLWG